ncbi:MAG: amidohydrolase family protein [Alphaproteobacteria bacterium]|nr:amidohydrolase family protein [Alphaproteobacteria bacterium]
MNAADIPGCPPPDPEPRPPKFGVPPGACDCHAHLFGPPAKYPYSPKRGYTPPDALLADFVRVQATLGLDRCVLTQPSVYATDNGALMDGLGLLGDRARGVAAVGADVTDAELERLHGGGVRGIRVNLVDRGGMPFDGIADVYRMGARIKDMGWHIELLIHVADEPDLKEIFAGFPVDTVVGHLGYIKAGIGVDHPGYRAFLDIVRDGHCWVKLSGAYRVTAREAPPYDDVTPYAQALAAARPDRIVWATDWPHPWYYKTMPNDGYLLDQLVDWGFDDALRARILVENPAELYGF